jgi:hypothetical protein
MNKADPSSVVGIVLRRYDRCVSAIVKRGLTYWGFVNKVWYHGYYRWTKNHRNELEATYQRVLKRRMEIIGK